MTLAPTSTGEQTTFPVPPHEQTLEVNYGFAVRPGVVLQPSLQYIMQPKGLVSIPNALTSGVPVPNALALGINTVINF